MNDPVPESFHLCQTVGLDRSVKEFLYGKRPIVHFFICILTTVTLIQCRALSRLLVISGHMHVKLLHVQQRVFSHQK